MLLKRLIFIYDIWQDRENRSSDIIEDILELLISLVWQLHCLTHTGTIAQLSP